MAFTGTATIKQISDRIVRITGLSLAGSASGTIGLHGATGTPPDVTLPITFQPSVYTYGNPGSEVPLADSVQIVTQNTGSGSIDVSKTGTTAADFRISLHNTSGSATANSLEMYISFHD
jgi:isopropylmalate/homocitrate/citramalate synthase